MTQKEIIIVKAIWGSTDQCSKKDVMNKLDCQKQSSKRKRKSELS